MTGRFTRDAGIGSRRAEPMDRQGGIVSFRPDAWGRGAVIVFVSDCRPTERAGGRQAGIARSSGPALPRAVIRPGPVMGGLRDGHALNSDELRIMFRRALDFQAQILWLRECAR